METLILSGFVTEQQIESTIFVILGIVSLCLSLFFFRIIKYSFFKGLAVICLIAGAIDLTEGCYTLATCKEAHYKINDNGIVTNEEVAFIDQKTNSVQIWKYSSVVFLIIGIVMITVFLKSVQTFWKGIGLGMLIQGLVFFTLFSVKEYHLKNYKVQLTQLVMKEDKNLIKFQQLL